MPRKTRKQKEKILSRRIHETPPPPSVKREFTFNFEVKEGVKPAIKKNDLSLSSDQNRHTAKDLARALFTALGIIGLELVLYWAWFK